ncbi:MAG: hypothetical protein JST93_28740 [Acidobacteria bacterium]|nr:hypothetical protein [Acidobacteriota bacterium]
MLAGEFHNHYVALVHECAHWFQVNGTSFGALAQVITYSQGRNCLGRLERMNRSKRQRLLERRIRSGEPITGELAASPDPEIQELCDNWQDHEVALELAVNGLDSRRRVDRETVLRFVFGVYALSIASQAGFQEYSSDEWAEDVYRPGERGIAEIASEDGRIGVRCLLEGAATAQELLAMLQLGQIAPFQGPRQKEEQLECWQRLMSRRRGYARAFRLFLQFYKPETKAIRRPETLQLFSFLCDLALNPFVPPAHVPMGSHYEWPEIYPPIRFVRLLQALRPGEDWGRRLTPDTVVAMREELLELAGLGAFPLQFGPNWSDENYEMFLKSKPSEEERVIMEHQRFRLWVQAQCWKKRTENPWVFVNCHDFLFGARGTSPGFVRNEQTRGWLIPPFRWAYKRTRGEALGMVDLDRTHGTDILLAAAADISQFELMSGTEKLTLPQFPNGDRNFIRRCVRASYENRFKVAAFSVW